MSATEPQPLPADQQIGKDDPASLFAQLTLLNDGSALNTESGEKVAKSQVKKLKKMEASRVKRAETEKAAQAKLEEERQKRLEEAAKIEVKEDASLPPATFMYIKDALQKVGERVLVKAWVHFIRRQGQSLLFLVVRDGVSTPFLQCVITDDLARCLDAVTLYREASVELKGVLKADDRAEGGVELQVDWFRTVGPSTEDFTNLVAPDSGVDVLFNNRHLVVRGRNTAAIMKARSIITNCFRQYFFREDYYEVTPPLIVQTQCEGGSTLFHLKYFDEDAYLTQSSQLYLETVLASMGKVFCIQPSFRAEKSKTRRHLSEFTHVEAELPFISFEDLLNELENLICTVCELVREQAGDLLNLLNPDFKVPERPFLRMGYKDAIKWLQENDVQLDLDDGTSRPFVYGDDIPEKPERHMTDTIGKPILLTRFPAEIKSFYMPRCEDDKRETESVDCLIPGVGEIIGGSMRIWNMDDLMEGYSREGISADPYYWFTDQRKFGSVPHGGYGLGLERFLCWILGQEHIRNVCLYPRMMGRCKP